MGDVIVGLATERVKSVADVDRLARSLRPGQPFHLLVQRGRRLRSFNMQF